MDTQSDGSVGRERPAIRAHRQRRMPAMGAAAPQIRRTERAPRGGIRMSQPITTTARVWYRREVRHYRKSEDAVRSATRLRMAAK
jgi:hypothetical protein